MQDYFRKPLTRIVLWAALVWARPAMATGVYFTTEGVLKEFFAQSERVTYKTVVTSEAAGPLRAALGDLPPKAKYTVFVAQTAGHLDGYAVIDEERGQHLPITIATQLDAEGHVVRTEVMAYRENYGEEIREPRFRQQFVGQGPNAAVEVVAISGASISSRSMTRAVSRAVALVAALRGRDGTP